MEEHVKIFVSCDSPISLVLIKCSVRFRLGPTNNPFGGPTMLVSKIKTRLPDIFKVTKQMQ